MLAFVRLGHAKGELRLGSGEAVGAISAWGCLYNLLGLVVTKQQTHPRLIMWVLSGNDRGAQASLVLVPYWSFRICVGICWGWLFLFVGGGGGLF